MRLLDGVLEILAGRCEQAAREARVATRERQKGDSGVKPELSPQRMRMRRQLGTR